MLYNYLKYREKLILKFWDCIPNKILYWAVNEAWARATSLEFTNKSPDEVLWSDVQNYLTKRGPQ